MSVNSIQSEKPFPDRGCSSHLYLCGMYWRVRCASHSMGFSLGQSDGTENHFKPFPGERAGLTVRRKAATSAHIIYLWSH